MICPNCHAEFRDGFTTCSDCEIPLVEDLESYDPDAASADAAGAFAGGPGDLVPLAELGSPEMLETLLGQLEEAQVPYVVQAGTAVALASGGDLESPGVPDPWQARVMVVGSFRPEARAMVDAIVAEAKRQALAARAASLPGLTS
jgi:hypothetical protein